jgi:arginase family enzyme
MQLTVLDLDGSLTWQAPVRTRLASGEAELVDLRDLGATLRLWAWERDWRRYRARLPADQGREAQVLMIGSGDYHHLTAAFLERVAEPVTLVHFDNHPDWAWTFPRRHCGSWVNEALSMPHVTRVMTLGCCSDDLAKPDRRGANLRALRDGRLAMHPWRRPPTPLGARAAPVPGHDVHGGHLHWRGLDGRSAAEVATDLLAGIPTDAVWISFDKDVLAEEEAATNWDQGAMPLAFAEDLIAVLAARHRILGVDICGDFSPARHRQPMKWAEARIDQPRVPPAIPAVNEATNARLLGLLERLL